MENKPKQIPISWILVAIMIVIAVIGMWRSGPQESQGSQESQEINNDQVEVRLDENDPRVENFLEMTASDNAVLVDDQISQVEVTVLLAKVARSSFVVIYENDNGVPGQVVGVSGVVDGEIENLGIPLTEHLRYQEVYYAILHEDMDVNGEFDPVLDQFVVDQDGNIVMMSFLAK